MGHFVDFAKVEPTNRSSFVTFKDIIDSWFRAVSYALIGLHSIKENIRQKKWILI